jgi:hypothetical protein
MTYWTALALQCLGREAEAQELFLGIETYSRELGHQLPEIDYFATSLPTMLLFREDLVQRNLIEAKFLRAQAFLGLNRKSEALALLNSVLEMDQNQIRAADLLQGATEQSALGHRN